MGDILLILYLYATPKGIKLCIIRTGDKQRNADLSSENTLTRITTSNPFRAGNCTNSQLISTCVESDWPVENSAEPGWRERSTGK